MNMISFEKIQRYARGALASGLPPKMVAVQIEMLFHGCEALVVQPDPEAPTVEQRTSPGIRIWELSGARRTVSLGWIPLKEDNAQHR